MANKTPDLVFELPYRCKYGDEIGSVVLLPFVQEVTEPLDRRACTLQEQFLSLRILEYCSLQTRFICQNSQWENLRDGFEDSIVDNEERSDELFNRALGAVLNKAGTDAFDVKEFEDHLSLWYMVLLVYTHRSLTLSTDRLPAISGIATRFGEIFRDDYCAGLWKSQLARELLWTQSPYPELKPSRSSTKAPHGPITITTPSLFQVDDYFKVLDCQIRLHSQAPKSGVADKFGAVESGKVVLRGHLQRAELTRGNRVMIPE
jgi:hypothetical protein